MGLFSFLKGKGSYLGVDIGTATVKLVQLGRGKEKPKLEAYGELQAYGYLERPNDAIQTSSLKMLDEDVAAMLRDLMKAAGVTAKKVSMSVPVFSSFVTVMELPLMSAKELAAAVPYEAKQYIPIPLSEVALDYSVLGTKTYQSQGGATISKSEVLLVAVPNEVVNKYARIAELAKLQLDALEIETFSLARSLVGADKSAILVIDIGTRATNISVMSDGFIRFSHNLDLAGGEITKTIATALNVDYRRAEEFKKTIGLGVSPEAAQIKKLISPLIDMIVSEADRLINEHYRKYNKKIERVIVSGGTANMAGLVDHLAQHFGVEVLKGNPFLKIEYPPVLEPAVKDLAPNFSVAIGLAMRGLV